MIVEAIQLCDRLGLHKPVAEQCQYNVLNRTRFEKEYRSLFEKYKYGTTTWSPLAAGFLSGKYNDGNVPEESRMNYWEPFFKGWMTHTFFSGSKKDEVIRICAVLAEIAKELGCTQVQLALAWILASSDVSTVLLGISKLEQLDENVKALEIYAKWDKDLEFKIETMLKNGPDPRVDYR